MPKYTSALLAASFLVAISLGAAPDASKAPRELRRHKQLTTKDGLLLYHYTEITRFDETVDESILLVRDEGYGDFVIRNRWTFEDQIVLNRISDVKDRAFAQQSYKTLFASTRRRETLAESHANPAVQGGPVIVRIETNGGQWEGVETDWNDFDEMRRLRHDQRMTMNFSLLEALERMRGTFFSTDAGSHFYRQVAKCILYDAETDATAGVNVKVSSAQPHCDFDEAFGFPCSAAQLARIAKAQKDGKDLHAY